MYAYTYAIALLLTVWLTRNDVKKSIAKLEASAEVERTIRARCDE